MADPTIREAFVSLHGERLHGFALAVTLGDRTRAGLLAADALRRGADRVEQLRHPERAAAWLRAMVTAGARGKAWGSRRPTENERREALLWIGVDPATFDALAALDARGRAAVAASAVEGLSSSDVFEIVGDDTRVRHARRDFLAAYHAAARARGIKPPSGPLAARVRAMAAPVFPRTAR